MAMECYHRKDLSDPLKGIILKISDHLETLNKVVDPGEKNNVLKQNYACYFWRL